MTLQEFLDIAEMEIDISHCDILQFVSLSYMRRLLIKDKVINQYDDFEWEKLEELFVQQYKFTLSMRRITGFLYIEQPREEYNNIKDLEVISFNIGKFNVPTFIISEL